MTFSVITKHKSHLIDFTNGYMISKKEETWINKRTEASMCLESLLIGTVGSGYYDITFLEERHLCVQVTLQVCDYRESWGSIVSDSNYYS